MMFRTHILPAVLAGMVALPGAAIAAGGAVHIRDHDFSWEGPFGHFDQHQLQRGLQVYIEVCAACHGLKYASFRELARSDGPALPDEQVKAIANMFDVPATVGEPFVNRDGENIEAAEPGDTRPALPSDKFPENTGAGAPDLTKMALARAGFHGPAGLGLNQMFKGTGGPEYLLALLTGYQDPPECAADVEMDGYYNVAFAPGGYPDECKIFVEVDGESVEVGRKAPGSWISMPPPLDEGLVEYVMHGEAEEGDGHGGEAAHAPEATVEHMAEDVTAFLMWAAEPTLVERKSAGFKWVGFLILLTVLLYLTNKKLWAPVKRKD